MIAIDLTFFTKEEMYDEKIVSGIGTWIAEFIDTLIDLQKQDQFILVVDFYSEEYISKRFPGFRIIVLGGLFSALILKLTGKSTERILKKIGIASRTVNKNNDINIIWFPFVIPELVYSCNCRTVLTIHDFMTCNTEDRKKEFAKMFTVKSSIVVISEYVSGEFKTLYPEFEDKIKCIIPNSIKTNIRNIKKPNGIRGKFILDINRYSEHKNPLTLIKAFEYYLNTTKDSEIQLAFCGFGSREYYDLLQDYINKANLFDRIILFWRLPEDEKNWLLKHATLFVTPSTNEGLGRTPLEAMMYEIPVISTKETSLYEATLGLAEYYNNPYDDKELGELLVDVINEPPTKIELNDIAKKVSEIYSPIRIVEEYCKLFEGDMNEY